MRVWKRILEIRGVGRGEGATAVEAATMVFSGINAPCLKSREEGGLAFLLKLGPAPTEEPDPGPPTLCHRADRPQVLTGAQAQQPQQGRSTRVTDGDRG